MEALLNEIELFPSRFCKGFAQPAWFMEDAPFTVNIVKNHPVSLRISHYDVVHYKFELYVQAMRNLEDCEKELRDKKILYKELTTYGDLEDVFRLMYVNEWFSEPESESSIQVTE